jgi:hypothetical protein
MLPPEWRPAFIFHRPSLPLPRQREKPNTWNNAEAEVAGADANQHRVPLDVNRFTPLFQQDAIPNKISTLHSKQDGR